MLKSITICLLMIITLTAPAAAAIDISRTATEDLYGEYRLVQDNDGRMWTRDEWEARPTGSPPAAEIGYLTEAGDRTAAVWVEYDRQAIARKVTTILDRVITLRDLGRYFPDLRDGVVIAGSGMFIIRGYPRDGLAAYIPRPDGDLLVTFLMADRRDATRLNTHSPIRGFSVARMTSAERGRMLMADKDGGTTDRDGSWRRVENFLRPGLHFSETLIARRRTDMIVIHHTKIENMTVASIHDLHLANGWAGIGYHKVILPDGTVADGRPEYAVGAHAVGANTHSVGITVVGDFDTSVPSPAQMASLVALTAELAGKYGVSAARVVGHRDVYKDTTCPGKIFPWDKFKQALGTKMTGR